MTAALVGAPTVVVLPTFAVNVMLGIAVVARATVDWARGTVGDGLFAPVIGATVTVGGTSVGVGDGGCVHGSDLPPGVLPLTSGMTNPTARARTRVTTVSRMGEDRSPTCISCSWT
jgi:hypothetical protein